MSTTPAFSPGPWMTRGPLVGSRARWTRELLYEQCSLHMTLATPSSEYVGALPKRSSREAYSVVESLCERTSSGVIAGSPGRVRGSTPRVVAQGAKGAKPEKAAPP